MTPEIQKELELRSARDEAATNYFNCKIDAEEKDMIAMQAIEKQYNDKWTVERRNALLADAYIAQIALEETHTAWDAAFEEYQEYIFNQYYVIHHGKAAENFPDGWETEWQPSFDAATPEPKPAPKYTLDEPITPPRMTADDLQFLEFEASEIVQRQPETPENIARVAEIDAILAEAAAQRSHLTPAEIAEIDKAQREINDAQKIIDGAEFRI